MTQLFLEDKRAIVKVDKKVDGATALYYAVM